jgi:hypothetical protein
MEIKENLPKDKNLLASTKHLFFVCASKKPPNKIHLVDAVSTSPEICLICSEDWHSLSHILFKRIQLCVLADTPVDDHQ